MSARGDVDVAAAIDVGSNSVLLLVVALGQDGRARAADEAALTTRLGAGLVAGGALDRDAVARTTAAVVAFADRARAAGASDLAAFATGAARRAVDGPAVAASIAVAGRCPVEILSGEREAALAHAAAVHGLELPLPDVLTVDVGGMTTELTLGHAGTITTSTSLALGALALTERCGGDCAAIEARVAAALAATDVPARAARVGAVVVGSGGTPTALAALALGLARYEPQRIHGVVLSRDDVGALGTRRPAPTAAIDAGRAAILPAGACILAGVMRATGADTLRVSDHGVRHGYLRERLEATGRPVSMRALWG